MRALITPIAQLKTAWLLHPNFDKAHNTSEADVAILAPETVGSVDDVVVVVEAWRLELARRSS